MLKKLVFAWAPAILAQKVCFMGPKQTLQPKVCFYLRKVSFLKFVLQVWSSCFGGFHHIAGQSHGSTIRLHHAWAHMALPNASPCISLNWLRHRPPCCWSLLLLVLPLLLLLLLFLLSLLLLLLLFLLLLLLLLLLSLLLLLLVVVVAAVFVVVFVVGRTAEEGPLT